MRKAINEKNAIINAHRALIGHLYHHIQNLEQNSQLLRNIISVLKETLIKNSIQLPDIYDDKVMESQTNNNELTKGEENPLSNNNDAAVKAAALITTFKESGSTSGLLKNLQSPMTAQNFITEYDTFFKQNVELSEDYQRPAASSGGMRRTKPSRKQKKSLPEELIPAKFSKNRKCPPVIGYGGEYMSSRPTGLSTTHYGMKLSALASSPESVPKIPDRFSSTPRTARHASIANKLKKVLQSGELVSEIIVILALYLVGRSYERRRNSGHVEIHDWRRCQRYVQRKSSINDIQNSRSLFPFKSVFTFTAKT